MGLDPTTTSFWLMTGVRTAASIVVIFPALDTISVFPLIANTLGNNLSAAAVGPATIRWCARLLHRHRFLSHNLVAKAIHTRQQPTGTNPLARKLSFSQIPQEERKLLIARASRLTTIFWRLVAAVPPLLGSIVTADLSFSLLLAGVAGVYVAFFAPSLMQLKSLSRAESQNISSHTIFQGWYSPTFLCYPVLAFATFSLGAVLLQIKGAWLDMGK
jgi:hypothetical protein